jgi:L-ascorbate metabolism protein UlaG (beta-lactamase superfamily)
MKRRGRLLAFGGLSAAAALALLGTHVDWFSSPRGWRRATGWDRIPAAELPAGGSLLAGRRDEPEIRWLGHAGFRIRWGDTVLLTDPNLSPWCTLSRRVLAPTPEPLEIGPVDAVLISHAHFDHLDLPTLRSLVSIGTLALPSGNEHVVADEKRLAARVLPLVAGDGFRVGELEVIAVPAAHNSGRLHPFATSSTGLGYVIRRADEALYFAGDTGFRNDFESIGRAYHPRIAILPIGAYAPRFPLSRYHLNPEEAVAAARRVGAELVIPAHFGTFTLSLDRPDLALPRFAHAAAAAELDWAMPRLLGAAGLETGPADRADGLAVSVR